MGKKAVIISISDYEKLEPLQYCRKDGDEMYTLLETLGFEMPTKRDLIGTVSYIDVHDNIINFYKEANVEDMLLFYFSGHGVLGDGGRHYLASSETDPIMPEKRAFSFEDLNRNIENCDSTKVVVALDCCYSGAAAHGKAGNANEAAKLGKIAMQDKILNVEGAGKYLLASSQSFEKSYPMPDEEYSAFTYFFLEGLKGNKDSVNKDGYVTPELLGKFIDKKIRQLKSELASPPRQTPVTKGISSGDVFLAHYPDLREILKELLPLTDVKPSLPDEQLYLSKRCMDIIGDFENYDRVSPTDEFWALSLQFVKDTERVQTSYGIESLVSKLRSIQLAIQVSKQRQDEARRLGVDYETKNRTLYELYGEFIAIVREIFTIAIRVENQKTHIELGWANSFLSKCYNIIGYTSIVNYITKSMDADITTRNNDNFRSKTLLQKPQLRFMEEELRNLKLFDNSYPAELKVVVSNLEQSIKNFLDLYNRNLDFDTRVEKILDSDRELQMTIRNLYEETLRVCLKI